MFVYNIPTNSIGPAIQRRHPDGSSISQSGGYVVLGYPTAGTGPTQGTWLLRDDMTVVRQMVSNTPESGGAWVGGYPLGHNDFGWGVDGSEVLVYVEPGGGGVCAQRLDNGLEYWVDRNTISGVGHVSCTAYDRPGYAALSSTSYYTAAPGVNALFVVRIEPWSASTRDD